MTEFRIICVGKVKEAFFRDGIESFLGEIRRYHRAEILECADEPTPDMCPAAEERAILQKEGERILKRIRPEDYVIALCIDGKRYSSEAWIRHMRPVLRQKEKGEGAVTFVIGGSLGLSEAVIRRADEKLSFSGLTFPHQMMRMILCQQISVLAKST